MSWPKHSQKLVHIRAVEEKQYQYTKKAEEYTNGRKEEDLTAKMNQNKLHSQGILSS